MNCRSILFRRGSPSMSLYGSSCVRSVLVSVLNTGGDLLESVIIHSFPYSPPFWTQWQECENYQHFELAGFCAQLVRCFAVQIPGTRQWICTLTRALIYVCRFWWYHQRYRCDPCPHLYTHVRQSWEYDRSVINPPVTCRPQLMSKIFTYTIDMFFTFLHPVCAFCTVCHIYRLTCTYFVWHNLGFSRHVSWWCCWCLSVRYGCSDHDRWCTHSSSRSLSIEFKCVLPYFHGTTNLDCYKIRPPTNGACIACGACVPMYKTLSTTSTLFYGGGFAKNIHFLGALIISDLIAFIP